MDGRKLLITFALAVTVLAMSGCSDSPSPSFRVTNRSDEVLSDVQLSGSGFAKTIARLDPNETQRFEVDSAGESGVAVAFTVDGEVYESPEQGYFESGAGYRVTVTINRDLTVQVDSDLY